MANQTPLPPPHPVTNVMSKYWWVSIPVAVVTGARAFKRHKKGDAWHEQAFQVANDLGVISFPITAMIMIYEFGKTQKDIQQLQYQQQVAQQQSAPMPGA